MISAPFPLSSCCAFPAPRNPAAFLCGAPSRARFAPLPQRKRIRVIAQSRRDGDGSQAQQLIVNTAIGGALVYLAATGKLGWIVDTIFSIWLILVIAPLLLLAAYLIFMEQQTLRGNCPNCRNELQVLKFTTRDEATQLCPFCNEPFAVDVDQFVRVTEYTTGQGAVVDIEAEVLDD